MADARAGVNLERASGTTKGAGTDGATMTTVRFDLPTPEGDTIEFWEAAKARAAAHPPLHRLRRLFLLPPALLPEVLG